MKILNFGSCNIDYVYRIPRFVRPGETISSTNRECFAGGKGLNQSVAIAKNGVTVYHAGCIGPDGLFLKEFLDNADVNTEYLKVVDSISGHAIIQVNSAGDNSIILFNGANYLVDKPYIDDVLTNFGEGDMLVLQNEISNIDYLIECAHSKKMKVILNPSPFDENMKGIDLKKIYLLTLNEVEAVELCGSGEPEAVMNYFKSRFEDLKVILTLGVKGSIYFDKEKEIFCPAYLVEVEDTTVAGDTYTGYFVSGIYKGYSIEKSLKIASAAAALAVSRKGASVSIPYSCEVEEAIKTLKVNTRDGLEIEKKKIIVSNYINNNLENPCLEHLAKLLGYSKAHTTVWIKENLNTSFSSLVKTNRCKKAAQLLRETDMPIDHVIKRVGYENGSFFRRIFKEMFGKSPYEYRRFYTNNEKNSSD